MAIYTANDTRDQQLTGGSEADTFYTGHNSVILTGGGAGDTFVFQHLPWNNTGHVRDFALGVDKLDFSALFAASGYAGTDPVADGYLRFASDGAGGTRLLYDPDGAGTAHQWPILVTTLDQISPTGLTWAQLSNSAPPPDRERIAMTDGGYVELWYDASSSEFRTFHVQKYNAAGTAIGPEHSGTSKGPVHIVALSDAGYAEASFGDFLGQTFVSLAVYHGSGGLERNGITPFPSVTSTAEFDIASSPHGGFMISTGIGTTAAPTVFAWTELNRYDNSGAQVQHAQLAGTTPQIDVLSDGTYRVSWTDDGAARTLSIDPRNPPDLSSPAPTAVIAIDNVAPGGGSGVATTIDMSSGQGWTNDPTPTLRFTVTELGELDLVFNNRPGNDGTIDRTIVITAADVANGYIDVPYTLASGETTYRGVAQITDATGVVSPTTHFSLNVDTLAPPAPSVTRVTDDAGSSTGDVARGGTTDDTTPTLQIAYTQSGTTFDNDRIQLWVDGTPVGAPVTASADDAARGYVIITSPTLSPGQHSFSATMTDGADNVSPLGASYTITVAPDSGGTPGQTFTANNTRDQVIVGTTGDDTFFTGHNSVILTGGGGADDFIYQHVPWNNTGHIRDFTSGVDVIDLRPIFQAVGYTGSNPIADGYLRFASDGAGGTQVLFDRDGSGSANPWPSLVTTLDNIQPSGIHTGDWLFA